MRHNLCRAPAKPMSVSLTAHTMPRWTNRGAAPSSPQASPGSPQDSRPTPPPRNHPTPSTPPTGTTSADCSPSTPTSSRLPRSSSAPPPGQIAFTDSTTMGLGLLYSGMRLRTGQDVVTSTHDFTAHHAALDQMARRTGTNVRKIPLYDDPRTATATDIVTRLRAALTPTTRIVAITWVHSSTGVRLPVPAIAAMITDTNAEPDTGHRTTPDPAVRRRRPRLRHPRRRPRLRLPVDRHPQMAVRTTRHRPAVGPRLGRARPDHPHLLRRPHPRRPVHPRRLPLLRTPLGTARSLRTTRTDRPRPHRPADHHTGDPPQDGLARIPTVTLITPDMSAGHRVLRSRRHTTPQRRGGTTAGRCRRERHPLRTAVPAVRPQHRVTTPEQMDRVVDAVRALTP